MNAVCVIWNSFPIVDTTEFWLPISDRGGG